MKPRHTAEQSTVNVNKASMTGKVGFGALRKTTEAKADESELMADSAPSTMTVEPEVAPQAPVYSQPVAQVTSQPTLDIERLKSMNEPVRPQAAPAAPAVGFAARPKVIFAGAKTCPTDPAELAQCDSCQ